MKLKLTVLSLFFTFLLTITPAYAGFEFCPGNASDGDGGSGNFQQDILLNSIVDVGELPAGISGVTINLSSTVDIDIQLYDKETGERIVRWPDGILSGPGYQSLEYHGNKIEWSGYNGDGTGVGHEYIKLSGITDSSTPTNRPFIMKVFAYKAGSADVNYTWKAAKCNVSDGGTGSFQQQILKNAIVNVGDIPTGVKDLVIKLNSAQDVDVQLYDAETGKAIIAWPSGLLNGPSTSSISYQNMEINWSGYNGDGTGPGNEYIKITGETTIKLTMKAFGYAAGMATVDYSWGGSGVGGTGNTPPPESNEILTLINQARSQGRNCGDTYYPAVAPLSWNNKLEQAALEHSKDMASNNYFSHTGLDGRNAGQRITDLGYKWRTWGENIAAGYFSAQSVMDGWLSSPGHCRNIMKSAFTVVGAAKANGGSYGVYWTQVFARPF